MGVFERRSILGGAAVTEEFHPGFRNSTASYTVSLLNPKVIRDLRLVEHGLKVLERPMQNFLPLPDGRALTAGPDSARTVASVRSFSARDAERLPAYYKMLDAAVALLRSQLLRNAARGSAPAARPVGCAADGPQLPQARRRCAARHPRTVHAQRRRLVRSLVRDRRRQGAVRLRCRGRQLREPVHPGSAYVLLHHVFGEVNGKTGVWGHAVGGMGAITQAMAAEARRLGVTLETDAPVKRIVVERGRATGIELEDGRVIQGNAIAANLGPKPLFLKLLADAELPAEFRARIERLRVGSATFRMNVALSELPKFIAAPRDDGGAHLGSGIILAPSLEYMDHAFADARLTGMSRKPIVEMLIPSTLDTSLAPKGAHVASLFCQHFSYKLPDGRDWRQEKSRAEDLIFATVESYAPNFRASILGHSSLSPLDLEEKLGLAGGDIFHGALGLDQLWAARPMLGYGDYRTPLKSLYLCGSGAHPGGGVTGLPGHNAAREILRDGCQVL